MKKGIKLLLGLSTLFGIGLAGVGFDRTEPVEIKAVSSTRLYVVVTDQLRAASPNGFVLYNGSVDVTLQLYSTINPQHSGDIYTYFTDSVPTNTMTLKHTSGQVNSINLYNIQRTNFGITWDKITFNSSIPGLSMDVSSYVTRSEFVPTGGFLDINYYHGETLIGTSTHIPNTVFTPQTINRPNVSLNAWYLDSELATRYVPVSISSNLNLYGEYVDYTVDFDSPVRVYIYSTTSWWYNSTPRFDIYYWKDGVTAQVQTMRKEVGNLHSVILPDASFTYIKIERRNPVSPFNIWNATGNMPITLTSFPIVRLSGPFDNNYSGTLTGIDFKETAPDISYLKNNVSQLNCSNYELADDLLSAYNRLGENEKSFIAPLDVLSHDNEKLSYLAVINYYVGWKAANATPPGLLNVVARSDDDNSMLLITIGALAISMFGYFIILRKRKIA